MSRKSWRISLLLRFFVILVAYATNHTQTVRHNIRTLMKKHKFKTNERYAVWLHHEKRCWLCKDPLRLAESTVDHVISESVLSDGELFKSIRENYGLDKEFEINGFENWLPSHQRCNQLKSNKALKYTPGFQLILERLIKLAPKVKRTSELILEGIQKDKLMVKIVAAIEEGQITAEELNMFIKRILGTTESENMNMIRLDNGYWLHIDDIAAEGLCQCERELCVDSDKRNYCYWSSSKSGWIIRKQLFWKCYEEIIKCSRCGENHKRGEIGYLNTCKRPFSDQMSQSD